MTQAEFQQRHQDYVFGPNQDPRLASVAVGQYIIGMAVHFDTDAPFEFRAWAIRCQYDAAFSQIPLAGLATRWTGPNQDYRQQQLTPAYLQMANYGQIGNPRPVYPPIRYPANGVMLLDIYNGGLAAITNLTFVFRGVKLFPWDVVPAYTYPPSFASLTFSYPLPILALAPTELRQNQIFQVKADADFVLRAGQSTPPISYPEPEGESRQLAEVGIVLKDFNGKPYSNDFVPMDVLFGHGAWPATIPIGEPSLSATTTSPFGTGPGSPGLFYPEIYVPANHQLWYDVYRNDGAVSLNQDEDLIVNLIGAKVFPR